MTIARRFRPFAIVAALTLAIVLGGGLLPAAASPPLPVTGGSSPSPGPGVATNHDRDTGAATSLRPSTEDVSDNSDAATIVFIGTAAAVLVVAALVVFQARRSRRPT